VASGGSPIEKKSNLHMVELADHKGQQSVERGFRFLKEPAFMTSFFT
jgi:transposase